MHVQEDSLRARRAGSWVTATIQLKPRLEAQRPGVVLDDALQVFEEGEAALASLCGAEGTQDHDGDR